MPTMVDFIYFTLFATFTLASVFKKGRSSYIMVLDLGKAVSCFMKILQSDYWINDINVKLPFLFVAEFWKITNHTMNT